MKIKSKIVLLMAGILFSSVVFAEAAPGAITFTVGNGYIFFASKRDLKNMFIPGYVGLTYNFDEKWATQVAANVINTTGAGAPKSIHGFAYLFDEIYRIHSSIKYVEPYVMGGFNVMSLKPIPNQAVNQGGLNAGIGAHFFKSSNVALSLEARDLYTFSGGKNDVLLNFGVNFIWV